MKEILSRTLVVAAMSRIRFRMWVFSGIGILSPTGEMDSDLFIKSQNLYLQGQHENGFGNYFSGY